MEETVANNTPIESTDHEKDIMYEFVKMISARMIEQNAYTIGVVIKTEGGEMHITSEFIKTQEGEE